MGEKFTKNIATVGGLTAISRVLGFVRDLVMAWLLGAGPLADAFIVAFRIPNLLRRFMAEGAVSVAFVPVFSEVRQREGDDAAFAMARGVLTLMLVLLAAVVFLGEVLAPALVALIAPGFLNEPIFATTVHLTRIMFPFILIVSLVALCMGILNSLGHFAAPAAAPILLNVFMIGLPVGLHVVWPVFASPADAFAWGVILGGVAQLVLQLPALRRRGFRLGLTRRFGDKRLRRIARLMGVAAIGASVYQVNVLVGTLLASLLSTGSVSYLYYANRMMELPLGIFAFAVGNVMLPSMSAASARTDMVQLAQLMRRSLLAVLFFLIPATVGLWLLAEPIFAVLFMRGSFGLQDVHLAAGALRMYALGLCGVGCSRILTQVFYAMQAPGTVVKVAWLTLGLNIVLCLVLMPVLQHAGIALAGSLAVSLQLVALYRGLRVRGVTVGCGVAGQVARMALAAAAMGAGLVVVVRAYSWDSGLSVHALFLLAAAVCGGATVYFVLLRLMGVRRPG